MLAFPIMIKSAADLAGMTVPEEVDNYDKNQFPHWHVFCALQLGRSMSSFNQHWENAKVIAAIPEDRIKDMTIVEFETAGVDLS